MCVGSAVHKDDQCGREFVDVCVVSQYSILIANERSPPVWTESAATDIYLFVTAPPKYRLSRCRTLYRLPSCTPPRVRPRCVAVRRGRVSGLCGGWIFFVGWVGYLSSVCSMPRVRSCKRGRRRSRRRRGVRSRRKVARGGSGNTSTSAEPPKLKDLEEYVRNGKIKQET